MKADTMLFFSFLNAAERPHWLTGEGSNKVQRLYSSIYFSGDFLLLLPALAHKYLYFLLLTLGNILSTLLCLKVLKRMQKKNSNKIQSDSLIVIVVLHKCKYRMYFWQPRPKYFHQLCWLRQPVVIIHQVCSRLSIDENQNKKLFDWMMRWKVMPNWALKRFLRD